MHPPGRREQPLNIANLNMNRKAPHRAYLELTVEGLSFCHYSFDSRAIMEFAPVLFPVSKSGSRTETMLHFRMQIQAKMR